MHSDGIAYENSYNLCCFSVSLSMWVMQAQPDMVHEYMLSFQLAGFELFFLQHDITVLYKEPASADGVEVPCHMCRLQVAPCCPHAAIALK